MKISEQMGLSKLARTQFWQYETQLKTISSVPGSLSQFASFNCTRATSEAGKFRAVARRDNLGGGGVYSYIHVHIP